MAELRYNPLLDDYTMISADRAKRPDMPSGWCPFCPGSGKVPEDYEVFAYDNDFPMLMPSPPEPDAPMTSFYPVEKSFGKCEVILYSPDHHGNLKDLSPEGMKKLIHLWQERTEALSQLPFTDVVFPFENRGREVGVTMPHPHGQIYAYSKRPLRYRLELENGKKYFEAHGKNLYTAMEEEERREKVRVVGENSAFTAFIPFFAEYPYGIYLFPKFQPYDIRDFNEEQVEDFGEMLHLITSAYDRLFSTRFPYMMALYNGPVIREGDEDLRKIFSFHVKFFSPVRGEQAMKFNASSETAAWVHGNPRRPEDCAEDLRKVWGKE